MKQSSIFSSIMSLDTFSLLDNQELCELRTDLTLHEMFKTRLLRVDQAPRTQHDLLQRSIHHLLRLVRYRRLSKASRNNAEDALPERANRHWSSQDTTLVASIIARTILAVTIAAFLIGPLAILSQETRKSIQMVVVATCIVAFACVVSIALRASNVEMMVLCAAYAAIISVFVSNSPESK